MSFTVVSTFSGCGGSSLGYKIAGGKVLLSVEWDENAAQTYRLNFPDTPVYHGDIAQLTVDEVLARTGLQVGELDIFDGSPPCQGFSTTGKRKFDDDRNQLFREYCRLLTGLKPKAFIMENVAGMVRGKMKLLFAEILQELKGCGYRVRARVLNAKHYGVPQSRERMIFVGIREDLGIEPSHPVGSSRVITVREALQGCEYVGPALTKPKLLNTFMHSIPGESFDKTHKRMGQKDSFFNMVRLSWDKPSPTVVKTVNLRMAGHLCPDQPNFLSIAAIKRLASFPDDFQFVGKFEQQWARIGNCVPPKFMAAIAGHVSSLLNSTPNEEFANEQSTKVNTLVSV